MDVPKSVYYSTIALFIGIVLLPIMVMLAAPFTGGDAAVLKGPILEYRHLSLAANSLIVAGGTTLLSLLIGVPFAVLLARTDFFGKKLFGVLYIIPILVPPYIHALVWTRLEGRIAQLVPFDIHSLWGVIGVLTVAYFPFVTLTAGSGIVSIERTVEEASFLHHGVVKTLTGVTIPLALPHIFTGGLFVFIFALINFSVPDLLRVMVYPVEIFIQFSAFYDEGVAALLSMPLIAITLFLVVIQKWYMKNRSYVAFGNKGDPIRYSLGRYRIPAFGFCAVVVTVSVLIPLLVLIGETGSVAVLAKALQTSGDQIVYSLVLALVGALGALMLSVPLCYAIERSRRQGRIVLEYLSLVPFAIPAITLGIGLIKIWNRPWLDLIYASPFIIVIGYIGHIIPFTMRTTLAGIKQIDPRLVESAALTTNQWSRVMVKIVLPLCRPSLLAGFLIAFVLSFGELSMTLLVIPPGRETLPIKIYNFMHYGADQMVAALCVILVAIVLLFSGTCMIAIKLIERGLYARG